MNFEAQNGDIFTIIDLGQQNARIDRFVNETQKKQVAYDNLTLVEAHFYFGRLKFFYGEKGLVRE